MLFKVAMFSTKEYDRESFEAAIKKSHKKDLFAFSYFPDRLTLQTVHLAKGFNAVCIFVNDNGKAEIIAKLREFGIRLILLRCAGFNNVDLVAASKLGIKVMRVPRYSPHAVAEHAIALMLMLTRNLQKSYFRVKNYDFRLNGLLGFDIAAKTVGVVGTGAIGKISAQILKGFGAQVLAYDPNADNAWAKKYGIKYVPLAELWKESDIITLHIPLLPSSKHMINEESLAKMKDGVMIINTSRGGLINTKHVIAALRSGKIGFLGIDVYENETPYFFEDHSGKHLDDPLFMELLSFPNVVCSAHQAFFTEQAMDAISNTTLNNATDFMKGTAFVHPNEVLPAAAQSMPRAKI